MRQMNGKVSTTRQIADNLFARCGLIRRFRDCDGGEARPDVPAAGWRERMEDPTGRLDDLLRELDVRGWREGRWER